MDKHTTIEMSAKEICDRGEAWRQLHKSHFEGLAAGTSVVIEVRSGRFVTGESWHVAQEAFRQKFGPDKFGYSFDVDRPFFVGGGLWLK